jgi:hypothetical protein
MNSGALGTIWIGTNTLALETIAVEGMNSICKFGSWNVGTSSMAWVVSLGIDQVNIGANTRTLFNYISASRHDMDVSSNFPF